jgi:hypothetical protein
MQTHTIMLASSACVRYAQQFSNYVNYRNEVAQTS